MSEKEEKEKKMAEEKIQEKWDKLFWAYNCPLQMWLKNDGTWEVLNYMPRKERVATLGERVTKKELHCFCKNASQILRNLAELFDALADGKIDTIYYPDKKVEDSITNKEGREGTKE